MSIIWFSLIKSKSIQPNSQSNRAHGARALKARAQTRLTSLPADAILLGVYKRTVSRSVGPNVAQHLSWAVRENSPKDEF